MTEKGGASIPDEEGKREGDRHKGEGDIRRRIAEVSHPLADKDLVDNVVK